MIVDTMYTDYLQDEIESIEYVGEEETIDITVTGNHLFWANNILTHNSAVQEQEHDQSMIGGGISKIQTADNVISIYATFAMKERGEYQLQFLKTRSSSGVGTKVTLGFDQNTLKIFNIEDSEIIPSTNTASDVFADLRRRNNKKETIVSEDLPTPTVSDFTQLRNLVRR